jgi:hypothetical protein
MTYKLAQLWNYFQGTLFPMLEDEIGPLQPNHLRLAGVLDLMRIEEFVPRSSICIHLFRGRPAKDRTFLARAFVAKVVFKLKYTRQLRDRLLCDKQLRQICGWTMAREIPSESKFSRAFAEFAESQLPDRVHECLIKKAFEGQTIGHAVIDSTPAPAREKPIFKKKESASTKSGSKVDDSEADKKKTVRRRGKNKTEEEKVAARSRCEKQASGELTLCQMKDELPCECTIAMKKKPGGIHYTWKGYKLHLASDPHGIPLAALITSSNINDHEAMISLTEMLMGRCVHFYQLMDSAYDVKSVISYLETTPVVPIVDKKPYTAEQKREKKEELQRRKILGFVPAEEIRYRDRKLGERPNGLAKDFYGVGDLFYKGAKKASCHIMFGILTLATTLIMGIE